MVLTEGEKYEQQQIEWSLGFKRMRTNSDSIITWNNDLHPVKRSQSGRAQRTLSDEGGGGL